MTTQPCAVDRDFPDHPLRDMLVAVEVEYLAGDLTASEFEVEVDFYLGLIDRRLAVID